jgi:hypothetical protein
MEIGEEFEKPSIFYDDREREAAYASANSSIEMNQFNNPTLDTTASNGYYGGGDSIVTNREKFFPISLLTSTYQGRRIKKCPSKRESFYGKLRN